MRKALLLVGLLLWALPAYAVGWTSGAACGTQSGPSEIDVKNVVVYCPNATNGATSPALDFPDGATCSWDDGGAAGTLAVVDSRSGVELMADRPADVACDNIGTACSVAGIFGGMRVHFVASATCGDTDAIDEATDCRVVCAPLQ